MHVDSAILGHFEQTFGEDHAKSDNDENVSAERACRIVKNTVPQGRGLKNGYTVRFGSHLNRGRLELMTAPFGTVGLANRADNGMTVGKKCFKTG